MRQTTHTFRGHELRVLDTDQGRYFRLSDLPELILNKGDQVNDLFLILPRSVTVSINLGHNSKGTRFVSAEVWFKFLSDQGYAYLDEFKRQFEPKHIEHVPVIVAPKPNHNQNLFLVSILRGDDVRCATVWADSPGQAIDRLPRQPNTQITIHRMLDQSEGAEPQLLPRILTAYTEAA